MITAVALIAFAIAVPAVAAWAGHRSAARAATERGPFRDATRRYGLTPVEVGQVESAVVWGKELRDERLRRAAVDWTQRYLDERRSRGAARSRRARVAAATAAIVVAAGALGCVAFVGRDVPWVVFVVVIVFAPIEAWVSQGPQRAIRLNAERPPD